MCVTNHSAPDKTRDPKLIQYINLKLASLGQPVYAKGTDVEFMEIVNPLIRANQTKDRLSPGYLNPIDRRIQNFVDEYLSDCVGVEIPRLPSKTFVLDREGLSRVLSLPLDKDEFFSDIVSSYRVKQGVLHNPKNDRRTTKGVFHIAEGGLPIPDDKIGVPKHVYANLLNRALHPPTKTMQLPFTSTQDKKAEVIVSLMLRPIVCPEVPGIIKEKRTEIRFFAPGELVSNLDFVESIFGNAGDPFLPENDAGLDIEHWTGHTGCVVLAPHLIFVTKKEVGLPHWDDATERQRSDGTCWKNADEKYNDGVAFKITARDVKGRMVTVIADNYFGYCKKEVKTQIGFSANLYGLCEEEHAGGAIAFPSYDLGEDFHLSNQVPKNGAIFADVVASYSDMMDVQEQGYGIDKKYPNIIYVPEDAKFNIKAQKVSWSKNSVKVAIKLLTPNVYILPSGYKIRMMQMGHRSTWRLVGTDGEGTVCHKPSTVSGGGKSEISKSIADMMLQGPVFSANLYRDFDAISDILSMDFGSRFSSKYPKSKPSRTILSSERSLGSVIKLFTPSADYTDMYNGWLKSIPNHIKEMIFVIKRHYRPEWENQWRKYFTVDLINGQVGHELKFRDQHLTANYLRVGRAKDGSWRIFNLRQDFNAADKIQTEDDITASVVVPRDKLQHLSKDVKNACVKFVINCENKLFQRPDDAIHRGFDKQAEADLSRPNTFLSNYEPLTLSDARNYVEDSIHFDLYTEPVKKLISDFSKDGKEGYFVSSSHPRMIDGSACKNPRYLQQRPDLVDMQPTYLAKVGARLFRKVPLSKPVHFPINVVLPGRRNNAADPSAQISALAVYNPIHYQELPELFMDFVCSLTGKSPSTTGFGSEGALTKGPFNAVWPTADLNNALLSYVLTSYHGFSSAAGYVGPHIQVDHDISLLMPEIWCRMTAHERDPEYLIQNGYLEKLQDFKHKDKQVFASRLGYRITTKFVNAFLGRIFNNPITVFTEEMLKPEKQDLDAFVTGVNNIVVTQKRVARQYLVDGSIEVACPPLKALLYIMAEGDYQGMKINDPEFRNLFSRDSILDSDWYQARLEAKKTHDIQMWEGHISYLESFLLTGCDSNWKTIAEEKVIFARQKLEEAKDPSFVEKISNTIGLDTGLITPIQKKSKIKAVAPTVV